MSTERSTPVRPTTVDDLVETAPPARPVTPPGPAVEEAGPAEPPPGVSRTWLLAVAVPPLAALALFGLWLLAWWLPLAVLAAALLGAAVLLRHKLGRLWKGRSRGRGGSGKAGWPLGRPRGSGLFSGRGKRGSGGGGLGRLLGGGKGGHAGGRAGGLRARAKSAASRMLSPVRRAATRARDAVTGRKSRRPGGTTHSPGHSGGTSKRGMFGRRGGGGKGSTSSTHSTGGGKGKGKGGGGSGSSDGPRSRTKSVLAGLRHMVKAVIPKGKGKTKPKGKDKPGKPDSTPTPDAEADDDTSTDTPDDTDTDTTDAKRRGLLERAVGGWFKLAHKVGDKVRDAKAQPWLDALKRPLDGLRAPKATTPETPKAPTPETPAEEPARGPAHDDEIDYPPPGPAPEKTRSSPGYDDEIIYPGPTDVPGPRRPERRFWDDDVPPPSTPEERPRRKPPTYDDVPIPPRHAARRDTRPERTYDDASNTGAVSPPAHGKDSSMSSALDQEEKSTPQVRATAFDMFADAEKQQIRDLDHKAENFRKIIRVANERQNQSSYTEAQVDEAYRQVSLLEQEMSNRRAALKAFEQAAQDELAGNEVTV